jgi:hypothetical protein
VLALLTHAAIVAENFSALMAAATGISVAALSTLGIIFGRIHVWVSVRSDTDSTIAHATIEAEYEEQSTTEGGGRLSLAATERPRASRVVRR